MCRLPFTVIFVEADNLRWSFVSVSHNTPYAIILKYPDYFILLLTLECFKMTA